MGEQQVIPGLAHEPRPLRKRPRTVLRRAQGPALFHELVRQQAERLPGGLGDVCCPVPPQSNQISRFTRMVSPSERTSDQTRQPGMKRTCVRSPDCFQITNIAVGYLLARDLRLLAGACCCPFLLAGIRLTPLLSSRRRLLET